MVILSGTEVNDDPSLRSVYKSRIKKYGYSSKTLFYKSDQQHLQKLKYLGNLVNSVPNISKKSVLDIGCGYGELTKHLNKVGTYTGIDMVDEFIRHARQKYPGNKFIHGNIFEYQGPRAEVCVLAGVLSCVPNSKALLCFAMDLATEAVVFDVTIRGRLPPNFKDLVRWSKRDLRKTIEFAGYSLLCVDVGKSWLPCIAERVCF